METKQNWYEREVVFAKKRILEELDNVIKKAERLKKTTERDNACSFGQIYLIINSVIELYNPAGELLKYQGIIEEREIEFSQRKKNEITEDECPECDLPQNECICNEIGVA